MAPKEFHPATYKVPEANVQWRKSLLKNQSFGIKNLLSLPARNTEWSVEALTATMLSLLKLARGIILGDKRGRILPISEYPKPKAPKFLPNPYTSPIFQWKLGIILPDCNNTRLWLTPLEKSKIGWFRGILVGTFASMPSPVPNWPSLFDPKP